MKRLPIGADALKIPSLLAASVALLCASMAAAEDGASHDRVTLEYVGGVIGLRMMRARVDANVSHEGYAGNLSFRSAGLAGFFKPASVTGSGAGFRGEGRLEPLNYTHLEVNGHKRREVRLTYEPEDVRVDAAPPFGSMGDPAATPAQKREAFDPLAMILQIALEDSDDPCTRIVPVFDTKQRYDLVFEPDGMVDDLRTRGYRGPAVRCRVYYRPLAGYDPEDLASDEVYATPIRMWLAEVSPGVRAPALIRARFSAGILPFGIKVELSSAEVAAALADDAEVEERG